MTNQTDKELAQNSDKSDDEMLSAGLTERAYNDASQAVKQAKRKLKKAKKRLKAAAKLYAEHS